MKLLLSVILVLSIVYSVQSNPHAVGEDSRAPHIGEYPGTNLNELQSLPGANRVIYLNISAMMDGETPKNQTKEDVWQTWQCVASAFSCFKVNVTTDYYVYEAAGVLNSCGVRFIDSTGRSSSGVDIFGTQSFAKVYRSRGDGRPEGGYSTGRTAVQFLGVVFGVGFYGGDPGGTYFQGFPAFKWVPIMGYFWYADPWGEDALYQWSKGEYNTANNTSDFLAIVNQRLPYRDDDIPGTEPLVFTDDTTISGVLNCGQICPNTDSDGFSFEIRDTSGHVDLRIDRIEYIGGAMLDVQASILDDSGNVVISHNAPAARYALLDTSLAQGTYTLLIEGGAEGTPQEGFSNYSSLGFYGIEGTIKGNVEPTTRTHTGGGNRFSGQSVRISNTSVMINTAGHFSIELLSADGRTVSTTFSSGRVRHHFKGIRPGVYLIRVRENGSLVKKRMVIYSF